jgi:hypothetical protein
LGGITANGAASITCEATVEASAYAIFDFSASISGDATVVCNGVRLGDNWSDVAVSDNTWDDVSQNNNTWTEISVSGNTWSDVSANSNTWVEVSQNNNTWLRQG